jgi:hypothetical protein
LDFLTGAPSKSYFMGTGNDTWNLVNGAVSLNYPVLVLSDSVAAPQVGLAGNVFFYVVGTYSIVDSNGNTLHNLLRLKSPTGNDASYTGNWNDDSQSWANSGASLIPFVNSTSDGLFFVEDVDFVNFFTSFSVTFYNESWVNSW